MAAYWGWGICFTDLCILLIATGWRMEAKNQFINENAPYSGNCILRTVINPAMNYQNEILMGVEVSRFNVLHRKQISKACLCACRLP